MTTSPRRPPLRQMPSRPCSSPEIPQPASISTASMPVVVMSPCKAALRFARRGRPHLDPSLRRTRYGLPSLTARDAGRPDARHVRLQRTPALLNAPAFAAPPVTPCTAPTISLHPNSQTVKSGQTVTFTAAASRTSPKVQWQLFVDHGDLVDVAGLTSPSFSATVRPTVNGWQVRAVSPTRSARPRPRRHHDCPSRPSYQCAGAFEWGDAVRIDHPLMPPPRTPPASSSGSSVAPMVTPVT